MATRTEDTSRSERVAVRASAAQNELIHRAAERRHITVTEFVPDVASRGTRASPRRGDAHPSFPQDVECDRTSARQLTDFGPTPEAACDGGERP